MIHYSELIKSKIILNPYVDFTDIDPNQVSAIFKLYSSDNKEVVCREYDRIPIEIFKTGVYLDEIFHSGVSEFLGGKPGYFTFYSDFPAFDCLTLFERSDGAMAMEHCFWLMLIDLIEIFQEKLNIVRASIQMTGSANETQPNET